jgi:hypothetical protein
MGRCFLVSAPTGPDGWGASIGVEGGRDHHDILLSLPGGPGLSASPVPLSKAMITHEH